MVATVKKVTKTTTKPAVPPTPPTAPPPGSYGIIDGISPAECAAHNAMITYTWTLDGYSNPTTRNVTSSGGTEIMLLNDDHTRTGHGLRVSWDFDLDPTCPVSIVAY